MSFVTLNDDVLRQVAEHFGVDLENVDKTAGGKPKRNNLIKELGEQGVTWEMYKLAFPDPKDLPEVDVVETLEAVVETLPEVQEPEVLLLMLRSNPKYEVRGYKFTKEHPFLPVKQSDASEIVANHEGFRVALPSEVEDFYS